MGRKSKLEIDPRMQTALVKQIELGVPIKYACANVGLDHSTFNRWIDKAEPREGDGVPEEDRFRYRSFRAAIARARAKKVEIILKKIRDAADEKSAVTGQRDVKHLLWILERTEREMFGPQQKIEAEVKISDPRAELESKLARLAARLGTSEVPGEPEPGGG